MEMGRKIIHIEAMERTVNSALAALAIFCVYMFVFHSRLILFWIGAGVLFVMLFAARVYLSKEETKTKRDAIVAQKAMHGVAEKLSLEYQEYSTTQYHPLFESTELAQKQNGDPALRSPKEFKEVAHFVRGKVEGQFIEGFVQEVELDLGAGSVQKNYVGIQTDAEQALPDIKFFITPRSRKRGIAGFIHRISQNPFAGAVDFRQVWTESPSFNQSYAVWVRRYDDQDEKIVFQVLTPEFMKMIIDQRDPLYLEAVYERLRIYHDTYGITTAKVESLLKLLVHMKNNIIRHQSHNL